MIRKVMLVCFLVMVCFISAALADTMYLPADTTTIGDEAFYGTDAVTIILPEGVTSIGHAAFGGSGSLREVFVPAHLMEYEEDALTGSRYARFYPFTDESMFECSGNDSLTITKYKGTQKVVVIPSMINGKPVTAIGRNAFKNSNSQIITRVVIPEGITEIGEGAFSNCPLLENINFPSSLTTLGERAFYSCGCLITDHPFFFYLPEGITSIVQSGSSNDTFYNCKAVKVVKPESVTAYKLSDLSGYSNVNAEAYKNQWFAFEGCEDYRYLYFTENGERVLHLMKYEGSRTKTSIPHEEKTIPKVIADGAFQGKTSLTDVEIPEGVETIGSSAFQGCVNLTNVSFPSSLHTLGTNAFTECGKNATVPFYFRLPDHISNIAMTHSATDTFANCNAGRIVSPSSETAYLFSEQIVGAQDLDAAFPYVYFTFPGEEHADFRYLYFWEPLEDGEEEQWVLHLIKYLGNSAKVTIPAQAQDKPPLSVIHAKAFMNNKTICEISIPDSVRRIGASAFDGCEYLDTVRFPFWLEYLEARAFAGCGKKGRLHTWFLPYFIKDLVYDYSPQATFYDCGCDLDFAATSLTYETFVRLGWDDPSIDFDWGHDED